MTASMHLTVTTVLYNTSSFPVISVSMLLSNLKVCKSYCTYSFYLPHNFS